MTVPREPDAIDSARVLAIALLLFAGVAIAGRELPRAAAPFLGLALHAGFLVIPFVYARVAGLRPMAANGVARLNVRQVALVLMAALGSLWILNEISHLQRLLFEAVGQGARHEKEVTQIQEIIKRVTEVGRGTALPLLVLAPALCEEALFRGIVFRGLARTFRPWIALVATAVVFAAVHGRMIQMALMFALGLYLGLLVWFTGSLWAGILAHGINNLAVIVLQAVFGESMNSLRAPWWMLALSIVVFALAMTLLALDRRRPEIPAGPGP